MRDDPDFALITDLSLHAASSAFDTAFNVLDRISDHRDRVIAVAVCMGLLKGKIDLAIATANANVPQLAGLVDSMVESGRQMGASRD